MDILGEGLRKLVLAGIGATTLTAEKAAALLKELVRKGELTVEQGKILNEELKHNFKNTKTDAGSTEKAASDPESFVKELSEEQRAALMAALQAKEPKNDE